MARTIREREEATWHLARARFEFSAIRQLLRDATTLHRYAELACNRELTAGETSREAAARLRVERAVAVLGYRASFNSDPRGHAVRLHGLEHADGSPLYNTWGGAEDGYGI